MVEDRVIRWLLPVEQGEDGDQILNLPDDLLRQQVGTLVMS